MRRKDPENFVVSALWTKPSYIPLYPPWFAVAGFTKPCAVTVTIALHVDSEKGCTNFRQ